MSGGAAGQARIGCSGWSYADWRGVVYPRDLPARAWFAQYAASFDTVELNPTFYRLPSVAAVDLRALLDPVVREGIERRRRSGLAGGVP